MYGKAAVSATRVSASKKLSPKEAWDLAIAKESSSISVQIKSCPRNAYLGLCEAGVVVGINPGKYGAPRDSKNGRYALKAYRILQSNPTVLPANLWGQATDLAVLKENHQMDVVLSLWRQSLLHLNQNGFHGQFCAP